MQRRFGCSGAETLLGGSGAWSTAIANVAEAQARGRRVLEGKDSLGSPLRHDRVPREAKAIARPDAASRRKQSRGQRRRVVVRSLLGDYDCVTGPPERGTMRCVRRTVGGFPHQRVSRSNEASTGMIPIGEPAVLVNVTSSRVLDADTGTLAWWVSYVGHGFNEGWDFPDADASSVSALRNGPNYPITYACACQTGQFDAIPADGQYADLVGTSSRSRSIPPLPPASRSGPRIRTAIRSRSSRSRSPSRRRMPTT